MARKRGNTLNKAPDLRESSVCYPLRKRGNVFVTPGRGAGEVVKPQVDIDVFLIEIESCYPCYPFLLKTQTNVCAGAHVRAGAGAHVQGVSKQGNKGNGVTFGF